MGLFKRWAIQLGFLILAFLFGIALFSSYSASYSPVSEWGFWTSHLKQLPEGSSTIQWYRLVFLIFGFVGVVSTYKLGFLLYNKRIGFVAAMILLSSNLLMQAFVRLSPDLILMGTLIFTMWQLMEVVYYNRQHNLWLAGLSMGISMAIGGLVGFLLPAIGLGAYFIGKGHYTRFFELKWGVPFLISWGLFLPFIWFLTQIGFLNQSFLLSLFNYPGWVSAESLNDSEKIQKALTGIFAYLPWSIAIIWGFIWRFFDLIIAFFKKRPHQEWLTPGMFLISVLIFLAFTPNKSSALIFLGPFAAIMTSEFMLRMLIETKGLGSWILRLIQMVISLILLFLAGVDFYENQPPLSVWLVGAGLAVLVAVHLFQLDEPLDQAIMVSFLVGILSHLVFLFHAFIG
jgi:4-amino-4-deoxy-L-arabinose transferase-like glycosyltransferase